MSSPSVEIPEGWVVVGEIARATYQVLELSDGWKVRSARFNQFFPETRYRLIATEVGWDIYAYGGEAFT